MKAGFLGWLARFDDFQRMIDRGELLDAREQLERLESESHEVASEGLDYHDVVRCLLMLAKADFLRGERRFDDCKRLMENIHPSVPMSLQMSSLIKGNVALQQGNLALHQEDPEGAQQHYEQAAIHASKALSPILRANALFNLGTCYRLTRQDEKAMDAFRQASDVYRQSKVQSKVADAYHQLGNLLMHQGRRQEAGGMHLKALGIYLEERNHSGLWMVGDDLSRVMYELASETRDSPESREWLRQSVAYSVMAGFSAEQVWQSAQETESEGRLADLSEQFLNHAMTQCELALAVGEMDLFLGTLARSKGRVRGHLLPAMASVFPDWPSELVEAFESGAPRPAALAVISALKELVEPHEVVAVVDQFSVQNDILFSGIYLCRGGEIELDWFESTPPVGLDEGLSQYRSMRGSDRCIEVWGLVNRYTDILIDQSEQCRAILGEQEQIASDSDRLRLDKLTTELAGDGKALGKWFFPDELLAYLKRNKVDHVVLVVDPSFPAVPYAALETSEGCVIDQSWSLSVATSALELVRWVARKRKLADFSRVTWFGPDRYVNNSLGGIEELQSVQKYFPVDEYVTKNATRERMVCAIASGRWVHFRGHGQWRGDVKTCGPVLYDGVLSRDVLESISGSPAFVVTAACWTGFSVTVGSELFGSLVDYERANCIGAVLTSWPIHGPFATRFMREFYAALARGENVAGAVKSASLKCREWGMHPYIWAPFMVTGFWKVAFSLQQGSGKAMLMSDNDQADT